MALSHCYVSLCFTRNTCKLRTVFPQSPSAQTLIFFNWNSSFKYSLDNNSYPRELSQTPALHWSWSGRPNDRVHLLLTQHDKTPWSTNNISVLESSFMYLLFLYKTLWHFSWRKLSMLQFSFPYLNHPWAVLPKPPEDLQCSGSTRTAVKRRRNLLHPNMRRDLLLPHWEEVTLPRWATLDASPPRSFPEESWPCKMLTLVLPLHLLSWWAPAVHHCQHPRRRAGPGHWGPRCETPHRPHARCAVQPEPRFALRETGKTSLVTAFISQWHQVWANPHQSHSDGCTDPQFSFKTLPTGEKAPGLLEMCHCWALLKVGLKIIEGRQVYMPQAQR